MAVKRQERLHVCESIKSKQTCPALFFHPHSQGWISKLDGRHRRGGTNLDTTVVYVHVLRINEALAGTSSGSVDAVVPESRRDSIRLPLALTARIVLGQYLPVFQLSGAFCCRRTVAIAAGLQSLPWQGDRKPGTGNGPFLQSVAAPKKRWCELECVVPKSTVSWGNSANDTCDWLLGL